jgi:hypothetical protein
MDVGGLIPNQFTSFNVSQMLGFWYPDSGGHCQQVLALGLANQVRGSVCPESVGVPEIRLR